MTALERINQHEEHLRTNFINHYVPEQNRKYAHDSVDFLLKAFHVMRALAIENRRDWAQDSMDANENDRKNFISDTEAEFEERMNEKESPKA